MNDYAIQWAQVKTNCLTFVTSIEITEWELI